MTNACKRAHHESIMLGARLSEFSVQVKNIKTNSAF